MKAWHLGVAVLMVGCASTAAGLQEPTRDGGARDASRVVNFDLTVLLDLRSPAAPGAGIDVRIEGRDGNVTEHRTDSSGSLRLWIDAATTYDVTVAAPERIATSLLGVRLPFSTVLRLPTQRPVEAAGTSRRTMSVVVNGRSEARSTVVLDGATGSALSRDNPVMLSLPTWTNAPENFFVSAVELDGASRPRRGGFTEALRSQRGVVSVALALEARVDRIRVEFPVVGRLTTRDVGAREPGSVLRFKHTELGELGVPVGYSELAPPLSDGFAIWSITRFEAPLAPEISTVSFATDTAPRLYATLTMQPAFVGLTPAFATVGRLATRPRSPGDFTFSADTGNWSRAYFEIVNADGALVWRGFAIDASPWIEQPRPTLPTAVLPELVLGRGEVRARTCVAFDAPQMNQIPWSHPRVPLLFWSRLSVCDRNASALTP